jgi:hypothetical protein
MVLPGVDSPKIKILIKTHFSTFHKRPTFARPKNLEEDKQSQRLTTQARK